jgi:catechol 2,3-dioxygenase-like lactoylglutathione lyase family enzyme
MASGAAGAAGVSGLDHVALPTADGERFLAFYKALGATSPDEADWRAGRRPVFSVCFGDHKINVHQPGFVANLRGPTATPGCGDLCFTWSGGLAALGALLANLGVDTVGGPVDRVGGRAGGTAEGVSVYVRDPDANLVEFICYDEPPVGRVR